MISKAHGHLQTLMVVDTCPGKLLAEGNADELADKIANLQDDTNRPVFRLLGFRAIFLLVGRSPCLQGCCVPGVVAKGDVSRCTIIILLVAGCLLGSCG